MFIPLVITPQKYKAFSNMYLFPKERIRNRPDYMIFRHKTTLIKTNDVTQAELAAYGTFLAYFEIMNCH